MKHSCGLGRDVADDLSRLPHFPDAHPRSQSENVGGDAELALCREAFPASSRRNYLPEYDHRWREPDKYPEFRNGCADNYWWLCYWRWHKAAGETL